MTDSTSGWSKSSRRFWIVFGFLALTSIPIGLYVIRNAALAQVAKTYGPPPDTDSVASLVADGGTKFLGDSSAPYEFTYPTTWTIAHADAESDSEQGARAVNVTSANKTSFRVALLNDSTSEEALLKKTLRDIAAGGFRLGPLGDVQEVGSFSGTGKQFMAKGQGAPLLLQVLVSSVDANRRVVITIWTDDADFVNGPRGVAMIVNSMKLISN